MSKYSKLWKYFESVSEDELILSYEQIEEIGGVSIDHSFLTYKKELAEYGFEVKKISMKNKSVLFSRLK